MTELVGARVEFPISESLILEHNGQGIGGAHDLLVEQPMEAPGFGVADASVIPRHQDLTPFFGRHEREIANQLVGLVYDAFEKHLEVFLHSGDRRGVKQIGVVFETACQWTIRVRDLDRQVELPWGLRYQIRFELDLFARSRGAVLV